jgi:hypothetical protein
MTKGLTLQVAIIIPNFKFDACLISEQHESVASMQAALAFIKISTNLPSTRSQPRPPGQSQAIAPAQSRSNQSSVDGHQRNRQKRFW